MEKTRAENYGEKDENTHCISYTDIEDAYSAIKQYIHRTPLITCGAIDKICGRNIYLKCENFQKTGSFKFRGAIYAMAMQVENNNKPSSVVTHSSGNHGQALAKAAQMFAVPAFIVMPSDSPQCKKDAVEGYGATVIECEPSDKARRKTAAETCFEKNGVLIYLQSTPSLMAGIGTMAMEMLEQNPNLDVIVAPVGSGGMIGGIAIAAKHLKPSIRVYAAEPERANDCYLSKRNGTLIAQTETPVTVADGVRTALCGVSWPIVRDLVDDVITVSEEEIKMATKLVWERAKLVIEPTSGVGVAAVMSEKFATAHRNNDDLKNVGVVLCGGNLALSRIPNILQV